MAGSFLNWIRSFLSGRYQYVDINNRESEKVTVISGVPQGSVIGPILFALFVNDLPCAIKNAMIKMFADDVKLYMPVGCVQDKNKLQ